MKHHSTKLVVLAALLFIGVFAGAPRSYGDDGAEYVVTFTRAWSEKTHPFEYPEGNLLTGPHFSGLIGAAHSAGFSLFREGAQPTPGLEKLSEEGKHAPLDGEIKAAIQGGKAGALFETGPIRDASKIEMTKVRVTEKFPMVSAVAMIAPSPDWFVGVANVNLKEGGKWVPKKTVELYAWDSGGDDGATYKASDSDTSPKKKTMKAASRHFASGGKMPALGTLTFTLQK